jgi:hypothetical protein
MTPSADQFSPYIIIELNSRTIVASLLDSVYLMSQLVSALLYYVFSLVCTTISSVQCTINMRTASNSMRMRNLLIDRTNGRLCGLNLL